jgi:hypothetical protein
MGYLLAAGILTLIGAAGSWRSWRRTDPDFKRSWRGRTVAGLLLVVVATLLAFGFHLVSGLVGWAYLPRGPFDDFVSLCLLLSLVPIVSIAFGRGGLRVYPVVAALGTSWLWFLVAAYSFM